MIFPNFTRCMAKNLDSVSYIDQNKTRHQILAFGGNNRAFGVSLSFPYVAPLEPSYAWIWLVLVVVMLVAIGLYIYFVMKRKMKKEEQLADVEEEFSRNAEENKP